MSEIAAQSKTSLRRLTTVVAADICGYSRLAEADESAAVKTVEIVFAAFDKATMDRRGRVFHRAGDGFLAEFPSAVDGILAAVEFLADIRSRNTISPNNPAAKVRAGVHVGDVLEQADGDLLGYGVNIAARLQAEADPNCILVSMHTVNLVRGKVDIQFRRRGALDLKNFDEPVVAFDILDQHHAQKLLPPLIRRFRTIRPWISASLSIVLVLLATNWIIQNTLIKREQEIRATVQTTHENTLLKTQIVRLSESIIETQKNSRDRIQILAVHDAAETLLLSEVPNKRRAVELIEAGNTIEAANLLAQVHLEQIAAGTTREARVQTLKEIGALIFYSDTPRAIKTYKMLESHDPKNPVILYQLGQLFFRVSEPEKAHVYYTAVRQFTSEKDPINLRAHIGVTNAKLMQHDFYKVEDDLEELRVRAKRLDLVPEQADILSALAIYEDFNERQDRALDYQHQSLVLERTIGPSSRYLKILTTYGGMLIEAGRPQEAAPIFDEALALSVPLKDLRARGNIYMNLGYLYQSIEEYERSSENAKKALDIGQREGRNNLTALSLKMLGENAGAAGDRETACGWLLKADKEFEDTPYKDAPPTRPALIKYSCAT